MIKDGNKSILKLALAMKQREWFIGLWGSNKLMSWTFVVDSLFSNDGFGIII
ncbi:MAG: hypothetical protein KKF62_05535 [Bacteroidetes bacterium]|nr:hypothetical protein [Bacteroidota bacterium]MBU1115735.1 hypothetical protein [Bacteroidota bacterium]MBU1799896.1 hypothetical protein [Bacteroidota bacterium]